MRTWLMAILICLLPVHVAAGAWPREEGSVFLSFGYTASGDSALMGTPAFQVDGYSTVYMEYGVTPRLTFGLDAGYGKSGDYTAIAFARHPLPFGNGPSNYALQAGVGMARTAGLAQNIVQIGASWGRGMNTRFGNGWLSLDSSLHYRMTTRDTVIKADLTVGIKPDDRTKLMLQVQTGSYPDSDAYLRLAPSVARQIRPGQHVELGIEIGVIGTSNMGLNLGSWLEF